MQAVPRAAGRQRAGGGNLRGSAAARAATRFGTRAATRVRARAGLERRHRPDHGSTGLLAGQPRFPACLPAACCRSVRCAASGHRLLVGHREHGGLRDRRRRLRHVRRCARDPAACSLQRGLTRGRGRGAPDRLRSLKLLLIVLFIAGFAFFGWFALIANQFLSPNLPLLFFTCTAGSLFVNAAAPLFCAGWQATPAWRASHGAAPAHRRGCGGSHVPGGSFCVRWWP
jgi:hypothetical protein